MAAPVSGFATGIGYLGRGFAMYRRHPRLMLLGLVPAVIAFVALLAAFVAMVIFVDDFVLFLTPYMADWPDLPRMVLRGAAVAAVVVVWVVVSIMAYVALTLLIGQPFYEAISKGVEDQLGGVPNEIDVSFWRSLPRTIVDSVRLGVFSVLVSVGLFIVGLIPVAGAIAAFVLGARFMGWVLALELTSVPFERRGLRYADRKQALRANRPMALGFGAATFACTLVPLFTVIAMPAAVAGATLLSRRILATDAQALAVPPR
ncbi:MAG: EI24 domain-containing protein [Micromonosporaceae bacterium]|nr:EI24 domain-containing protein [Micromonosporaceae bacterium]